jgi:hypothetical protein
MHVVSVHTVRVLFTCGNDQNVSMACFKVYTVLRQKWWAIPSLRDRVEDEHRLEKTDSV